MEFQFKVSVWENITVPDDIEKQVLQGIKDGSITCSDDIYNRFQNYVGGMLCETDVNTAYPIQGIGTIYVQDEEGKELFSN